MLQGAIVVGMTAMADEKGIGAISISGTGSLIAEAMDSQFSDFAAATGEPAALLEDWQKRLSLRFDEKGALPPRRRPAAAE
jgi:hypothetical protein